MDSKALADSRPAAREKVVSFGKYLLLSRVSIGGMAEVFKAIPEGATRIEQIVAIKRILPSIAEDDQFIGMFIDEARIAGQLDHPNICRIHELGKVGNAHYIAMQFLWGRDLLKLMNRFRHTPAPMPWQAAAFIAERASAALHYAHLKCDAEGHPLHIIHRDVSPQNIIVGYSGQIKLIDFGVARAASQNQKTQAGILKGKFGYMSPELIRGMPIDRRSDVFAMGACLYEALTSTRLFLGETDFATLELVRDARVEPPSRRVPSIPPEIDAIVLRALAREPRDRYSSAGELEDALRAARLQHTPSFGEDEMRALMQRAFAPEIMREKARLEDISTLLREERLVRGAEVLALPSASHSLSPPRPDQSPDLVGVSTRPVENPLSLGGDWGEQGQTPQIFFSAEELTEIHELVSEPMSVLTAEPIESAEHTLPPPEPSPRRPLASGTYTKAPDREAEPAPIAATQTESQASNRPVTTSSFAAAGVPKQARLVLATVALVLLTGISLVFALHRAQTRAGAIEVLAMGAHGAIVRVDGVVRGNPPLSVSGLVPGPHRVEVVASGYAVAEQVVEVSGGETVPVGIVLERLPVRAASAIQPLVEAHVGADPSAAPSEAEAAAPSSSAGHRRSREDRVRALAKEALLAARASQAEEDTVPSSSGGSRRTAATPSEDTDDATEPSADDTSADEEPSEEEEEAPVAETPTPAAQPSDGMGELLISTLPWSHVFIDDQDTGRDTPVRALKVAPGPHRVSLQTPDGFVHTVDIYVEPGQVVRIIRRF